MSSQATVPPLAGLSDTALSRIYGHFFVHESSTGMRILFVVVVTLLVHVVVRTVRKVSEWLVVEGRARKGPLGAVTQVPSAPQI